MVYVLNERLGEDASGKSIIEAHGVAHYVGFSVDHVRREPKIQYTTKPSRVVNGTRISVQLPNYERRSAQDEAASDARREGRHGLS